MPKDVSQMSDEDEQLYTMQKITDMLIAAGYFRARIQGLDPFDKVVGGMCWAIRASGIPIDIDVNFKENAQIGEKIVISENIVSALIQMNSPFQLKPHLIQSVKLNCVPLFPVIQWLVKSVYDYRRITGDTVRNYSKFLFQNDFNRIHFDKIANEDGKLFYKKMNENYQLKRQFKKQSQTQYKTKESFVDATLLEYGFKFRVSRMFGSSGAAAADDGLPDSSGTSSGSVVTSGGGGEKRGKLDTSKFGGLMNKLGHQSKSGKGGKGGNNKQNDGAEQEMETEEEEAKRLAELEKQMSAQADTKLKGSILTQVIDVTSVLAGKTTYEENQTDLNVAKAAQNAKDAKYKNKKQRLTNQLEEFKNLKKEYIQQYQEQQSKLESMKSSLDEVGASNSQLESQIAELAAEEDKSENKGMITKLKSLVFENEKLKKQEKLFKEECKESIASYEAKLSKLDTFSSNATDAETAKVEEMYRTATKKYDLIRQTLAEKNQEVAQVTRKLDSYPTRAELLQYEKRFVELYNLTNERLKETKKYYHLYNSYNDVFESIKNEVKLMEQIKDEFPKRTKSESDREDFIKNLDKIEKSLQASVTNAENKLGDVKKERDAKNGKYTELLNYQRKYYLLVKDFQNACNINEELSNRIESLEEQLKAMDE